MPLAGGTTRTVATSVTTPNGLTSDGKNAYWTDCSACDFATGRSSTGSLGSTRQGVEAYGLLAPTAVAVDANNVYWVNGGTFTCQPVSGGWSVQWDNANGSSIAKWPLNGGSSSIVVENLNVHTASMASDGTTLYWSDFFGVYATSIDTGHTDTVEGRSSRNVAVDARFVYWIDATSGSSGNIMKLPKGSTTPIELAKQQSQTGYTLRLDASNVYWSDAGLGAIFSAPIAGGPAVRMFQQSLTIADFVEANGAFYIAVPGTAANDYQDGQIVKIAK